MKAVTMLCVLLVSTSVLRATPVDITFTEDDIIQNGDSYNYAYLYNGGTGQTTVEMIGGSVEALVLYDDSHFIKSGGDIQDFASIWDTSTLDVFAGAGFYVDTFVSSTLNLYSGGVAGVMLFDSSTLNITGGTIQHWIIAQEESTVHISGDHFSRPDIKSSEDGTFHFYGTNFDFQPNDININVDGLLTGQWEDNSSFEIVVRTGCYDHVVLHEIPEPATLLLLGLGALMLRRKC